MITTDIKLEILTKFKELKSGAEMKCSFILANSHDKSDNPKGLVELFQGQYKDECINWFRVRVAEKWACSSLSLDEVIDEVISELRDEKIDNILD
jgi:hypothetical protein